MNGLEVMQNSFDPTGHRKGFFFLKLDGNDGGKL